MTESSPNAAFGMDDEPDPIAQLAIAMAAVNPLERLVFGWLIHRCIRVPKDSWVQAVNVLGVAAATRAVVAGRWSTITFITGLATFAFLSQPGTPAKTAGVISAALCVLALASYLARIGETLQALRLRRRR